MRKNRVRNQAVAMLTALFAVTLMNVYEGLVGMAVVLYMIAVAIVVIHSTIHPEVWNGNENGEEEK